MSLASSAAEVSQTATATSSVEVTSSGQLGDAFVGDLQYADERSHEAEVGLLQSGSSSSSSSPSEPERRNITRIIEQTQIPASVSWESFSGSPGRRRNGTGAKEVELTGAENDNDLPERNANEVDNVSCDLRLRISCQIKMLQVID